MDIFAAVKHKISNIKIWELLDLEKLFMPLTFPINNNKLQNKNLTVKESHVKATTQQNYLRITIVSHATD